jgi:hypothetical protein
MEKIGTLSKLLEDSKTTKGTWKLNDDHTLSYKEDGTKKEVKLDANLVAAEPGALVFSYTDKISATQSTTRIFKLDGNWKVDDANRITFEVEKETGKNDVLTFNGSWELNDSHEIVYTYTQKQLKTKTKLTQELLFKGHWDLNEKTCLSYYVGGDSDNAFHFEGAFESPSVRAKKGELRYQIGVEVKGKTAVQTIALFGQWLVSDDLSLDFEIEYSDGDKRTISFGGEYRLSNDRTVAVNLKTKSGQPIGVELVLTQDIFGKDGSAFLRLAKSLEDTRVEAGVKFKW